MSGNILGLPIPDANEEVWGYVMSNGYTARENVVAIEAMLEALTLPAIEEEVLRGALV